MYILKRVMYGVYLLISTLLLLEGALRILDYKPYQHRPFYIESTPKQCVLPDATLGFKLNEGSYQVSVNKGLTFTSTHTKEGNRISSYSAQLVETPKRLDIHGCSYTYGFGMDDSLSLPFRLQKALQPYIKVTNRAVLGYGTVQTYLILQEQIKQGTAPDMIIVNYASFHDDRNALTPEYRQDLSLGFAYSQEQQSYYQTVRFPYVSYHNHKSKLEFCSWKDIYQNWPLRSYSALVNLLQVIDDKQETIHYQKHILTRDIFAALHELCKANNIELLVTGIITDFRTYAMLNACEQLGIKTLNISVDLYDITYNNLPYDTHPNAKAHEVYSMKLLYHLKDKYNVKTRVK